MRRPDCTMLLVRAHALEKPLIVGSVELHTRLASKTHSFLPVNPARLRCCERVTVFTVAIALEQ